MFGNIIESCRYLKTPTIWNRPYALRRSNLLAVSAILARTEYYRRKVDTQLVHGTPDSTQLASSGEFDLAKENRGIRRFINFLPMTRIGKLLVISGLVSANQYDFDSDGSRALFQSAGGIQPADYKRDSVASFSVPHPYIVVQIFYGDWCWLFIRLTKHRPPPVDLTIAVQLESISHG